MIILGRQIVLYYTSTVYLSMSVTYLLNNTNPLQLELLDYKQYYMYNEVAILKVAVDLRSVECNSVLLYVKFILL